MGSIGDGVKKQWRLIVFILVIILIFWLIWMWRSVLLPFVLGFIFAYMLLPVIRWVETRIKITDRRPKLRQPLRIAIILVVFILALGIVGLIIFNLVNVVRGVLETIEVDLEELIPSAIDNIQNWLRSIPFLSSPSAQEALENYLNQIGEALPDLLINFLTSGWQIISASADTIIAFIIMPIFIFFILKDWEKLRDKFYGTLPPWPRKHTKGVFEILQIVVIRYFRGELLLGLIVGIMTYIMLLILGIRFAVALAIFSAITELVPMIGPWVGGALGVLVTLAIAPERVIWVAIGYLAVQQIENQVLVPRIQGTQLEIHPALVIVLGLLGAYFAGILGFIIILPATMAVIRLIKYFRDVMVEDYSKLDTSLSDDYLPPEE